MREKPRAPAGERALPTPRQIFEHLDLHVIGQTRAKQSVAIAAYNHLKRCRTTSAADKALIRKSNVLLMGPTGSGKTHIARTLATFLDVPMVIADATEYTEAGYYGKDVEVMIGELLYRAQQDVTRTQGGIVFIDEVDKIARRSHGARTGAGSRDIGGEGVQQALLKILEGREIFVPLNITQHWNKHDFVVVDTQDILFIAAGTFSDLKAYHDSHAVGFGSHAGAPAEPAVTEKDLIDYGLLAEFLGRLPVRVQLQTLSRGELLRVLTEPPDAVVKEYQALLRQDRVDLRFSPEALEVVVEQAQRRRTGARSLRTLVEELCHDVMFEAPERAGDTIVIDGDTAHERLSALGDAVGAR